MHDICNIMCCCVDAWNAMFSHWLCTRELVRLKKFFNMQSSFAATFVLVPLTSVWEGLGLQCMCGNGISVYDPAHQHYECVLVWQGPLEPSTCQAATFL